LAGLEPESTLLVAQAQLAIEVVLAQGRAAALQQRQRPGAKLWPAEALGDEVG
jgi:hypothetical protein